jgi:hypothetical protein
MKRVSELLTVMSTLAGIVDGPLSSLLRALRILGVHLVKICQMMFEAPKNMRKSLVL